VALKKRSETCYTPTYPTGQQIIVSTEPCCSTHGKENIAPSALTAGRAEMPWEYNAGLGMLLGIIKYAEITPV